MVSRDEIGRKRERRKTTTTKEKKKKGAKEIGEGEDENEDGFGQVGEVGK